MDHSVRGLAHAIPPFNHERLFPVFTNNIKSFSNDLIGKCFGHSSWQFACDKRPQFGNVCVGVYLAAFLGDKQSFTRNTGSSRACWARYRKSRLAVVWSPA